MHVVVMGSDGDSPRDLGRGDAERSECPPFQRVARPLARARPPSRGLPPSREFSPFPPCRLCAFFRGLERELDVLVA